MSENVAVPDWLSIARFDIVAFVVPVIYAAANGGIRRLMSGEKNAENAYIGVDLTLAALVTFGLYILEPQSRMLPSFSWETPALIKAKVEYGPGVAFAFDLIFLFCSMCIHSDYLLYRSKVATPSKWHKFCTGALNLVWNNALGIIAFAITALLLRG